MALVAVTLLLSWLMTQTAFAFRYAHAHGLGGADFARGLEFPGEQPPDYVQHHHPGTDSEHRGVV